MAVCDSGGSCAMRRKMMENVPHVIGKMSESILGVTGLYDLEFSWFTRLGYDAEWGCLKGPDEGFNFSF